MIYHSWFIAMLNFLSLPSSSQNILCLNALECVGDNIVATSGANVFARGYRSNAGSTSSIYSDGQIWCEGAFACDAISFISDNSSSDAIRCWGSNSCRNVSEPHSSFIQHTGGASIHCGASNSCSYSALRTEILVCHGDQSCAFSNIENAVSITGQGAYSLIYAVINSPGTGVSISISLSGYSSGYGANITCKAADVCSIDCYGNSCNMTYIECLAVDGSNCIISKDVTSATDPIYDIEQFISPPFNLLYDSQSLTMNNEQTCNEINSIKYDNYYNETVSDILVTDDNPRSICCRGWSACGYINNIQSNTTTQNGIVCSGRWGCIDVGIMDNVNGPIFCESQAACYSFIVGHHILTTNNLYCFGQSSCVRRTISKAQNIFCSGFSSCQDTTIISEGNNLNLYLLGETAGTGMTLYCNDTDSCLVICGGLNACTTATFFGNITIEEYTSAPTGNPTIEPTGEPTLQPTKSPTNIPTESPTTNPTSTPTHPTTNPTSTPTHPTTNPSKIPTTNPTLLPTIHPTSAPTACLDYDSSYNSFDGNDTIFKLALDEDIFLTDIDALYGNSSSVIKYETLSGVLLDTELITCTDDTADIVDICFIGCYEPNGCLRTRIEPENNINLNELRLHCSEKSSCEDAIVNITRNVEISSVAVICTVYKACSSMIINVEGLANPKDILLYCNEERSCSDLMVNLNANNMEMNVNIYCYQLNSCESLHVYTDHSEEINLNIFLFEHSDDVFIDFEWFKEDMVHCGHEEDHRYIRYDIDKQSLLDNDDILYLAENEYESRQLPCSDIKVECKGTKDDIIDRECEFEYNVNVYNLTKILTLSDSHDCLWMDINALIEPKCKGHCDANLTFYEHQIALNLDIVPIAIGLNMSTQQTICDEYLSTTNISKRSMDSIDPIFEMSLNILMSMDMIRDILESPITVLRDGIAFFQCNSSELDINPIEIYTKFTIESTSKDTSNIFITNGHFINSSRDLISLLFGIKVVLKVVSIAELINKKSYEKEIIITSSVLVFIIVFIAFWCYKKALNREEKYAINIRNPLVIPYCIGDYDEASDQDVDRIGGVVEDLRLSPDIYNIHRFCKEYQYEFGKYKETQNDHDCDTDNIHLHWTERMLMEDLKFQADKLESSLGPNRKAFDALLVIVSCHGLEDGIITSDYRIISKEYIHRVFSVTHPLCRTIPRIFLFDCCAGGEERVTAVHEVEEKIDEQDVVDDHKTENDSGAREDSEEVGKNVKWSHVDRTRSQIWYRDEANPDYKLVRIDAANIGFMAKMSSMTGSYLIDHFIKKVMDVNRQKTFLYQIMDEIQSELHDRGKQQIVPRYLNQTRYIRFVKNLKPKTNVEMQPIKPN